MSNTILPTLKPEQITLDLCFALSGLERNASSEQFYRDNLEVISKWLCSSEFSQGYIIANKIEQNEQSYTIKPFAPLTNPSKIEWREIPAWAAWALNYPILPVYNFIIYGSHAVGMHSMMPAFLRLCKCYRVEYTEAAKATKDAYKIYENLYERLIYAFRIKQSGKISSIALMVSDAIDGADKLYALIDARKALNIVRDPISVLKALCNTMHSAWNIAYLSASQQKAMLEANNAASGLASPAAQDKCQKPDLNLLSNGGRYALSFEIDPKDAIKDILYAANANNLLSQRFKTKPNARSLDFWLQNPHQVFHDDFLSAKLALKEVVLLDMSAFSAQRAFDTFKTLSGIFGFEAPNERDKELFSMRTSDYKFFYPVVIYANESSELYSIKKAYDSLNDEQWAQYLANAKAKGVRVFLRTKLSESTLSEHEIDASKHFDLPSVYELIVLSEDDFKRITSPALKPKLQSYINAAISHINDEIARQKELFLKEDDILAHLSKSPKHRAMLSDMLNKHLSFVKTHRPQIIGEWKYYERFLGLCKKDDVMYMPKESKSF